MHSQPLSIGTVELVDDSDSQFENKPARRSPNEPKETKIKPAVMPCGRSVLTVAAELALRLVSWT